MIDRDRVTHALQMLQERKATLRRIGHYTTSVPSPLASLKIWATSTANLFSSELNPAISQEFLDLTPRDLAGNIPGTLMLRVQDYLRFLESLERTVSRNPDMIWPEPPEAPAPPTPPIQLRTGGRQTAAIQRPAYAPSFPPACMIVPLRTSQERLNPAPRRAVLASASPPPSPVTQIVVTSPAIENPSSDRADDGAPATMAIGVMLKRLTTAQIWQALLAVAAVLGAVFEFGRWVASR